MEDNENKVPISKRFLVFIGIFILFLIIYLMAPNPKKYKEEPPSNGELLEYNSLNPDELKKIQQEEINQNAKNLNREIKKEDIKTITSPQTSSAVKEEQETVQRTKDSYEQLLDSLKTLPNHSFHSVNIIVQKLLKQNGYPEDILKVTADTVNNSKNKAIGSFLIASFEFPTGEIKINKDNVYNLDIKILTAVIAHETDHFDNFAKLCKSMGVNEFTKFLNENGVENVNKSFWEKAAYYADIKNFQTNEYKDAVKKYLKQERIEDISSYSNFSKLAETINNPLEISAYKKSDYIYDYYKIPQTEGAVKQITKAFNEVDSSINNKIKSDEILKDSKIALFDYYFAKAIVKKNPLFNSIYITNANLEDGNFTNFWVEFKKTVPNFYERGQLDEKSVKTIIELLKQTKEEVKQNTKTVEMADALKYEAKTLLADIKDHNTIEAVKNTETTYLKYLKNKDISNPKTEFDFILDLICIENELYTSNNKTISLYYIKIPDTVAQIYGISSKNNKFKTIYQNEEFKRTFTESKNKDNLTEQMHLISLLNAHRIKY